MRSRRCRLRDDLRRLVASGHSRCFSTEDGPVPQRRQLVRARAVRRPPPPRHVFDWTSCLHPNIGTHIIIRAFGIRHPEETPWLRNLSTKTSSSTPLTLRPGSPPCSRRTGLTRSGAPSSGSPTPLSSALSQRSTDTRICDALASDDYAMVGLSALLSSYGETAVQGILDTFEPFADGSTAEFVRSKAVPMEKRDLSGTHLAFRVGDTPSSASSPSA